MALAAAAWAPAVAGACPACARDGSSAAAAAWIGAMMLAPLALGALVFAVARRLDEGQGGPR
jgi:hypothetical protein